jgi:hypothetical protein
MGLLDTAFLNFLYEMSFLKDFFKYNFVIDSVSSLILAFNKSVIVAL